MNAIRYVSIRRSCVLLALVAGAASVAHLSARQTPQFQSSVEVTSIDVTVLGDKGKPPTDLQPSDFTVRVGGSIRRVVSAQWVPLATSPGKAPASLPEGYSGNENMTGGRLILLAVDQPNLRVGGNMPLLKAVGDFLDHLEPSDRIAAVSLGTGAASTPFTGDRDLVKQAVARMSGEARLLDLSRHDIALAEAADFERNDTVTMDRVFKRECDDLLSAANEREACHGEVTDEAHVVAENARMATGQTIARLRALLQALGALDAPKTLVLISEGFPLIDQDLDVLELGSLAGAARTSIYVLQLDNRATDITGNRMSPDRLGDQAIRTGGLDLLASASRGTLLRVTGGGSAQLAQIASELSGYYLVGLESEISDKDGRPHPVSVSVGRRGLTVRSRRQLLVRPAGTSATLTPRDEVVAGLLSPLVVSSLPLRVASFSVREPETSKVQVLIHADIGADYSATEPVSLGYTIVDSKSGRLVDSQAADARLPPVMKGVPSALQYATTASLDPGEYTLKLAVADGDRVGTVEHPIHARLLPAGSAWLSDLMVGGPATTAGPLQPTVGYGVAFGVLHGYVEAYGPADDPLSVKYEVATAPDAPALLDADAPGIPAGRERTVFSQMLPVRQLPAGKYVLRAIVSSHGAPIDTMTRPFEVEAPAVLMTSAAIPGATTPPADVYLPVGDEFFARKFRREDAGRAETLRAFRDTVGEASRSAFDQGVRSLSSGDYAKAEQSFKSAIRPDDNATAPMAYLAAVYAATGNDAQAAGAWQTSLIDGADFPQIYEWLGDTLIRTHELAEARTVFEEAIAKWPSDPRFAKPLSLVYAVFGQGREAVRTLERYLATRRDDYEALSLGVEWMFHLHSAGAVAQTPADDLKLARGWADAYTKSGGPQAALVKEWMTALERLRP